MNNRCWDFFLMTQWLAIPCVSLIYDQSVSYIVVETLSQIRYSLVVIIELNGVSEVQYKDVMMIDDGKYQ